MELDDFIQDFEAGQDQKAKDNKLKMLRTHTSHALKHMVRDWSLDGRARTQRGRRRLGLDGHVAGGPGRARLSIKRLSAGGRATHVAGSTPRGWAYGLRRRRTRLDGGPWLVSRSRGE